jgi:radical SAM protein with 4Fe4S-binding SPASM domain
MEAAGHRRQASRARVGAVTTTSVVDVILKKLLEGARDKLPAYQLCSTPEMGAALTRALTSRLVEAADGTFVLTKLGEKELKKKPKTFLPLLTHSEIQCFQRCPREHHYRYRLRRRPKTEVHELRFGKVFDESLQAWWEAGPLHGREAMLAKLEAFTKANDKILNPFDVEKVRALLFVYDVRWGNEPYEIIRVQPTFRMPILNPQTGRKSKKFELGGKLDVLVRDVRTGEVVIIETKTTKSSIENTSMYWHTITVVDPQVSTYFSGARAILKILGIKDEPRKCVYDVIRKPQLRPLKATPVESREYLKRDPTKLKANQRLTDESFDEYADRVMEDLLGQVPQIGPGFDGKLAWETLQKHLARKEIVRLEHEEYDHAMNVWQIAKIIGDFEDAKIAPQHKSYQCRRCPYLPVCGGTARIEDYQFSEERHEELKEI